MGHIQAVYVIVKTGSLVHAVHVSTKLFSLFLVPHIDWSFMLYVGLVLGGVSGVASFITTDERLQ